MKISTTKGHPSLLQEPQDYRLRSSNGESKEAAFANISHLKEASPKWLDSCKRVH